jgi:2-dehydro-3-deoxyphosphooctonate aldolase (KDO 8-P synthase)
MIETIGKAAVAAGADGIFVETHPKPSEALSDGANMLPLAKLPGLLSKLKHVHEAVRAE